MNRMLTGCPICGSLMHATEVRCDECDTTIRSSFEPCRFCHITSDQMEFVIQFLRYRGDIEELADALNLEPHKVSRKLEQTLAALELTAGPLPQLAAVSAVRDHELRSILDMLDHGDISAEEATRKLKDI